ncbi:MAG TPA: NAD-glutamate dehydrogenase domain-containing protein, partial [Solirubrobacteraceae bacterium]|nr:NAD-glutamate dehydrogenase domain-containing protein [Solirubrobacteraceae bacterium]
MAVKAGKLESDLIDALCRDARESVGDGQGKLAEAFVRQYYHWVPADDLAGRTSQDLLGAALAHLEEAAVRAPGQTKVRVFDPAEKRDGYSSPYTVIEIVSDDMPFIVDSLTMEIARQGLTIEVAIHPVIRVRRDEAGRLTEILEPDADAADAIAESVFRADVRRPHDPERLEQLQAGVERVLGEVHAAVADWRPMRSRALELADELKRRSLPVDPDEVAESAAFLEWLAADQFTFLGYREYDLPGDESESTLTALPDTGLGILRGAPRTPAKLLRGRVAELAHRPYVLVLTKANSRATVHRPAHLDYIGVKRFDAEGRVVGECRFLGLYATTVYRTSPLDIPLLRGKVKWVLKRAGFPAASHDGKALLEILETLPRDALVQIGVEDLFTISMGLLRLGERPRVRLFAWPDPLGRFVYCTVTVPRDRFNTENRERAESILLDAFGGREIDWGIQLSESVLVRVNYVVWSAESVPESFDLDAIEGRLVDALRGWDEELAAALRAERGEDGGAELYQRYQEAFPAGYRSDSGARQAVEDIGELEGLSQAGGTGIRLYRLVNDSATALRCRLYSATAIALSDVVPTFEHMGTRVIDERPFRITPQGAEAAWIYDFGLRTGAEDLERVGDLFQEAFIGAVRGEFEDDGLGGLVLRAALTAREIVILRTAARYLRQAGIAYSDAYMERTLNGHPDIARLLVKLFVARFDPDAGAPELGERLARAMEMAIDGVASLDEDRILRSFLSVIRAVLRTNYFRTDSDGRPLPYVSIKLDPSALLLLPRPRPRFEIFVYSPTFEAVHLRGGKVARGGIRWSDRPEDFRSEILGLMKAQMVKNALIVPVG